jgi:pyruvate, water dikinase
MLIGGVLSSKSTVVVWLRHVGKHDLNAAGGKGAKLGELSRAGFRVPDGFVITADFYRDGISRSGISPKISWIFSKLNLGSESEIDSASRKLRSLINSIHLDAGGERKILAAYRELGGPVAVRSSATAEDLKEASFAGQQETFLNVSEGNLIGSVKRCMSSLYTPQAIAYRHAMNIDGASASIAVVVQKMVRVRASGVAFSANPSTNNENELVIEAAAGGATPDRYVISKGNKIREAALRNAVPVLSDKEAKEIASVVNKIAGHFRAPQDVEWAIDTEGKLNVLQSRPITTLRDAAAPEKAMIVRRHEAIIRGTAASRGRARGKVIIVKSAADLKKVKSGDVIVAVTTSPDYVPTLRRACAIVTDEGGILSHVAIVSRELNLPCVAGTKIATKVLKDGDEVEVDGDSGAVFRL